MLIDGPRLPKGGEQEPNIEPNIEPDIEPNIGSPEPIRGAGMRFNAEKMPLETIPLHLLEDCARVFDGVTKREVKPYPMWNWAKGMPWSVPYACMLRHLAAWYRGEDNDPETGINHLGHVMCNLLMLTHYKDAFPEGDNRPVLYFKPGGMDVACEQRVAVQPNGAIQECPGDWDRMCRDNQL